MSEPISGGSYNTPLQPPVPSTLNVPLLSKQMQSQASTLADQLQKIVVDPSLSTQESFLHEFTENGNQLNQTVEQAILMR
jgi:hypothetical protein